MEESKYENMKVLQIYINMNVTARVTAGDSRSHQEYIHDIRQAMDRVVLQTSYVISTLITDTDLYV